MLQDVKYIKTARVAPWIDLHSTLFLFFFQEGTKNSLLYLPSLFLFRLRPRLLRTEATNSPVFLPKVNSRLQSLVYISLDVNH